MGAPEKDRSQLSRPGRPKVSASDPSAGYVRPCRPDAQALAERDARLSHIATPNMAVLGDPPPGRSALDGWQQKGEGTGRMGTQGWE